MAVYYKFKSAKDYDVVAIDGNFISVGNLKEKIFELKHLGRGTDFDLVVTNAQSNEEYLDEGMLIPKNTSVLIRRVPGRPRMRIVTAPVAEPEESKVDTYSDDAQAAKISLGVADQSATKYAEDLEWDEFGNDLYAIPDNVPAQMSNLAQLAPHAVSVEDEDSKIKALIDTSALDWQRQSADGFGPGRGFGRGMGGRMMGGRGFGRGGGLEKKTPPPGYICHRCKVAGHFIQHCPTNGDPYFDVKRVKPPTGIPKSMLMATPDGSYALPSGAVAVLKPNEAAFEKEIEGMPSTRSVAEFGPELHCPLCKQVMKDAVLTGKCCHKSFCYKCIKDHFITKSSCVCGATNVLADDLIPNFAVRDSINRILESTENGGSAFQVQDLESHIPRARVPSPTQSAASKGEQVLTQLPQKEESSKIEDPVEEDKAQEPGNLIITEVPDVLEATNEAKTVKEAAAVVQGNAPLGDDEVQQKVISGEAGKKKKRKKIPMPPNETQWRNGQDFPPDNNYMMPMGPPNFNNPYWNGGIQPGFDGFVNPYGGPMPHMGYGYGPMDVPYGGMLPPHDPFLGPGCMLPYGGPPQRDLAELAMGGYNSGPPPVMSREEFESHKARLMRKREMERNREREFSNDREYGREGSSTVDGSSMKFKNRNIPPPTVDHHRHRRSERPSPDRRSDRRSERPSPDRRSRVPDLPSKKKHDEEERRSTRRHRSDSPPPPPAAQSQPPTMTDKKLHKASVFSRISFPLEGSSPKKRKLSPATTTAAAAAPSDHRSNGHREEHKAARKSIHAISVSTDQESSDDERHFKRRPARYNSSPPPAAMEVEEHRHSRGSRDKHRERSRERYSKHR